ncbi:hypothetical protein H4R34_003046 [Dimargaris verticillata]|uniref:Lysosomal dipeptide transporter MFSD1 n=1 Tax=Dimargaris verticillata TaxID=2761393 RepID=A0A9W8B7M3_9FUNG|nr:hypothetical protein H4R34_003046 [Dimargaris verticillata]
MVQNDTKPWPKEKLAQDTTPDHGTEDGGSDTALDENQAFVTWDRSALHKQEWMYKVVALFSTLMLSAGSHFVSNSLSSLKSTLKQELSITNTQYGVLSGTISLVNTVLPFVSGVIMDKFGAGWGAFFSCFMIVLGNMITIVGTYTESFAALVVGRVIFGFGSSTIVTAQETILSHWFRGKGLALSIGVQIMVSKLFGWLASATIVEVAERTGFYGNAFWVGEAISLLSFLMVGVYFLMMWKLRRMKARSGPTSPHLVPTTDAVARADANDTGMAIAEKSNSEHGTPTPVAPAPNKPSKRASWHQLWYMLYFPDIYWLLPLNEFIMGAVWTPFLGIAAEFVKQRWHKTDVMAAWTSSISLAIPIAVSPLMGLYIDRFGHRGYLVMLSAVLLIMSMGLLGYSDVSPEAGLTLFSLSLTVGPVALTSAVALYLPIQMVGTGIGLVKCALNFGIIIVDVLIGRLQDLDDDQYDTVMIMLMILAALAFLSSALLTFCDFYFEKGLLSASFQPRNQLMERRKPREYSIVKAAEDGARVKRYKYGYPVLCVALLIVSWVLYGIYLLVPQT